tara:strand:- start:135 stop:773 length:639 start_codon:yes stop_codon:yes gene_type:complete
MKNTIIFIILLSYIAFSKDIEIERSSQWSVSCDVASRYVWRGTDFGNSPSIQPGISYTSGALTLGAWSAWQFSGQANENDLYASFALGEYYVTLTDYYFPGTDFNETNTETGSHNIELSLGGSFSGIRFTTAIFLVEPGFYGAFEEDEIPISKYISLSFGPFILELGDGGYTSDGEFNTVGIGVTASNGKYSCTWTLNPDSGQAYLIATKGL